MGQPHAQERDLVLVVNEFAYVLDETKGNINCCVGPIKQTLENTDFPMIFNGREFERTTIENSKQRFTIAPEGWYIVLKNPAAGNSHPDAAAKNLSQDAPLEIGRKINIPGPDSFSLYPGQSVEIIQGHHLRTNNYLIVKIYDEDAAKKGLAGLIIKPQQILSDDDDTNKDNNETKLEAVKTSIFDNVDISTGKLIIIKGTDASFFIPPTGMAVVMQNDNYKQNAVTLESLEYCILLDENGKKRYVQGPDTVFPEPTEEFITKNGVRKFKAIELNNNAGIYSKVIESFESPLDLEVFRRGDMIKTKDIQVGDELFRKGSDTPIYYPDEKEGIIKYGDNEVHHATVIPKGKGRYVMNRQTGEIKTAKGADTPIVLLDPRTHVFIQKILTEDEVNLWFPGNTEAIQFNANLRETETSGLNYVVADSLGDDYDYENNGMRSTCSKSYFAGGGGGSRSWQEDASDILVSKTFDREGQYTAPRTIQVDQNKFDGAVVVNPWTGYAIKVIDKDGKSKIITGPTPYVLDFDETLETVKLSTGTPKSDAYQIETPYLNIMNNRISDSANAKTKDLHEVKVHISYLVDFIGKQDIWFNIPDVTGFLTETLRSQVRNYVRNFDIESFYQDGTDVIRDFVLGKKDEKGGKRPGKLFEDNNMFIKDVMNVEIAIQDDNLAKLFENEQRDIISRRLKDSKRTRDLADLEKTETYNQAVIETELKTKTKKHNSALEIIRMSQTESIKTVIRDNAITAQYDIDKLARQEDLDKIATSERARVAAADDQEIENQKAKDALEQDMIAADTKAWKEKFDSMDDKLVAALQSLGDKNLAVEMSKNMSVQSLIGGDNLVEVFKKMVKGTPLEEMDIQEARRKYRQYRESA